MFERLDIRPGGPHCTRIPQSTSQKISHKRGRRNGYIIYSCSWLSSWKNKLRRSQRAHRITHGLSPASYLPQNRLRIVVRASGDRKGGWGLFPSFNSWEESAGEEEEVDEEEESMVTADEDDVTQAQAEGPDNQEDASATPAVSTLSHGSSSKQELLPADVLSEQSAGLTGANAAGQSGSAREELEALGRQREVQDEESTGKHRGRAAKELAQVEDGFGEGVIEYVYQSEVEPTRTEWEESTVTEFQPWPAPPLSSQGALAEQKASGWALAFAVLLAVRLGRENAEAERYNPSALQVKQQESRIQSRELREKRKQYLEQERKAKEAEAQRRVEEARLRQEKEDKQRKERERQQRIEAAEEAERVRLQQEAARKAYLENEQQMEEEIARRAEIERQILLENEKKRQEEEERARVEREAQLRAEEEVRRRAAEEAAARAAEVKRQQQLEKQRLRAMTTWFGMHVKASVMVGPAPDGALTEGRVTRPASVQVTVQMSCSHSPATQPTLQWNPENDDSGSSSDSGDSPQVSPRDLYDDAEDFFPSRSSSAAQKSSLVRDEPASPFEETGRKAAESTWVTSSMRENADGAGVELQRVQCFSSVEEAADDFPTTAGAVAQELMERYMSGPSVSDALSLMDETELQDWKRAAALRVSGMVLDAVMVILQTMQRSKAEAGTSTPAVAAAAAESYDWEAEVVIERGVLPKGHKKRVDTLLTRAAQVCNAGLLGEAETVLLAVIEDTEHEWSRGGLASLPSSAIPILIPTSVSAHLMDRSTGDIDSKSRLYQLVKHQLETQVRDAPRDTLLPLSRMLTAITGSSHPIAKIMAELADRNLSYAKREALRLRRRQEQWELSQRAAQLSEPTAAESAGARVERRDSLTPIPERVWALRNVAGNILAGGDPGHAVSMLTQASALSEEYFGASHPGRIGVLLDLCEALSASPDPDPTPLTNTFSILFEIIHTVVERYATQGDHVSAATVADAAVRAYDGRLGKELTPWLDRLRSAAGEAVQKLSTAERATVLNRRRTPGMRVLRQLAAEFSEQLGAYSASSTTRTSLLEAWNKNLPLPPSR